MALLATIVRVAQDAKSADMTLNPLAECFGRSFSTDGAVLQMVDGSQLAVTEGHYGATASWMADDQLVKEAIATRKMQVAMNIPSDAKLATVAHYVAEDIQSHVVVPVIWGDEVLAVLSLYWHKPTTLRQDELVLLHLSAQQVSLVLTCNAYDRSIVTG